MNSAKLDFVDTPLCSEYHWFEFRWWILLQDSQRLLEQIVYVVLTTELEIHKIPVTGHLYDIRRFERVNRENFVSKVRDILDEFNLSGEDRDRAVKKCVRVMKEEKLITR